MFRKPSTASTHLSKFNLLWIEEPTSPDDVLGHAAIARAVAPVGVATGEHCANRVLFKQLLQADAISFCQIDSCRLGGVNENLAVILMAAKFGVPVCPHAGGVGLCELRAAPVDVRLHRGVGHARRTASPSSSIILHEHFVDPVVIKNARYMPPLAPGYSAEIKPESRRQLSIPNRRGMEPVMSRPSEMILIAGPYRSGTGDEPARMAANVRLMEAYALPLVSGPVTFRWWASGSRCRSWRSRARNTSATKRSTRSSIRLPSALLRALRRGACASAARRTGPT